MEARGAHLRALSAPASGRVAHLRAARRRQERRHRRRPPEPPGDRDRPPRCVLRDRRQRRLGAVLARRRGDARRRRRGGARAGRTDPPRSRPHVRVLPRLREARTARGGDVARRRRRHRLRLHCLQRHRRRRRARRAAGQRTAVGARVRPPDRLPRGRAAPRAEGHQRRLPRQAAHGPRGRAREPRRLLRRRGGGALRRAVPLAARGAEPLEVGRRRRWARCRSRRARPGVILHQRALCRGVDELEPRPFGRRLRGRSGLRPRRVRRVRSQEGR